MKHVDGHAHYPTCLYLFRHLATDTLHTRGVREWLSVFPIPPIPTWSFPFPFPKFMHCETCSHSHTIPDSSFPFPPIPIPAKSLTNRNISKENVRNVFRVHRLRVRETRRTEYKYTDISDYSKHKALSTLATIVAEFGNGDEFGDSRGQGLTE